MQEILAVGLTSMHQDMQRLDQVSMNLTNSLTPGYKRQLAVSHAFSELVQNSGLAGGQPLATQQVEIMTDNRPGTLKFTGQSLDLALGNDGYFEVSTDQGPAYTRQGNFQIDSRGRIVTSQGYPVMGKNGEIFVNTNAPSIDSAGNVSERARTNGVTEGDALVKVDQLKILKFANTKQARHLGNGLLALDGNMTQTTDDEIKLQQGYLENSNVSSVQEMVQLMQTMRHFESMQRTVQGYDELLGTAIRKLGDV